MRSSILPLALLFIAFTNPSIAQKAEAEAQAQVQEVVVAEGAPLEVPCSLRVSQRVEWLADGAAPAGDLRAAPERPAAGGAALSARLLAPRARPRHAGLYTCTRGGRAVRVRVLPAAAAAAAAAAAGDAVSAAPPAAPAAPAAPAPAPAPELVDLVRFKLYQPLTFNCTPNFPIAGVEYKWYKNGTLMEGLGASGKVALEERGAVLTIKRALEDDHGNYTCSVGGAPGRAWEARAYSLARVPSDTNVVEGQKFSIACKLYGKPYERVRWTYSASADGNATELALEGRFSAKDSPAGVPAGVLEVADAKREDAGVYTCEPAEGEGASSVLRVKDVYAALWPFLGICLEVFILCAIILVYEKRRTKPELDDSDADTHDQ